MNFNQQLQHIWQKNNSLVCVGLDPDINKLPPAVQRDATPLFAFNRAIIETTHDLVCAYKPQIAYYHARGAENELAMTIDYIKSHHPAIPVILDAKRGDIGSTAQQYACEAFERYQADAVTVNPYLGHDALQPFLDYQDKGVIILCHTSNPGAAAIQELTVDGAPLYERVAEYAAGPWNQHNNISLVIGGTYPQALRKIRSIIKDMPMLVPGIGAQGADIQAVVGSGQTADGTGLMISASRSIIYASQQEDFAKAARLAALALRDEINQYRGNI